MDYIAQNPYRVLGVFANDPLKVRTANIAKINVFRKVGKMCDFENDYIEIFGDVDRSEQAVETAIAQLSNDDDAAFFSLLWLHRTENFPSKVSAAADIISANRQRSSYGERINTLLAAYVTDNHALVADVVVELFKDNNEKITSENKSKIISYIVQKFTAFEIGTIYEWWNTFKSVRDNAAYDGTEELSTFISNEFNKISISDLRRYSSLSALTKDYPKWKNIINYHNFAKNTIKTIKETSGLPNNEPNAEGQIALSEFANFMLKACQRCYKSNRYSEAKPVLEIIKVLRELYVISYSSKVKEDCAKFGKALKEDVKYLAPEEVHRESVAIQKEIEDFCEKPDKVHWAITLVINCVAHLIQIKSVLGADNLYYRRVSTQIADNALYSCSNEVESAKRKYENPRNDKDVAKENLCHVLQLAMQLCVDIREFDAESEFVERKLSVFEKNIKSYCEEHSEIVLKECKPSIVLHTIDDEYKLCNDYASLQEYVRNHPNSPNVEDAIKRIWSIEDEEYPKMGLSIIEYQKAFLAYKEKYPFSHNDAKVLVAVNRFFLKEKLVSPKIYRKLLQLWPNHPQRAFINERIDHASFLLCKNEEQLENYLKEFPNGLHREEAKQKIQQIQESAILKEYEMCYTIADYNRFILKYPSSKQCKQAIAQIEELVYNDAVRTGIFSTYYQKYPNGKYVQILKDLEEEKTYKQCQTPDDFQRYLDLYPNGKYAEIAHTIVKRAKYDRLYKYGMIFLSLFLIGLVSYGMTRCNTPAKSMEETVDRVENTVEPYAVDNVDSVRAVNDVEPEIENPYINNSLRTGSKPYSSYFGRAKTGENYIDVKTAKGSDYIIIVKQHRNRKYINHIYIKGGESARMYIPDGTFDIFFYSGKGWNPNKKVNDELPGGFVFYENFQKDTPRKIVTAYLQYELYPVTNGNLLLDKTDASELLK